jgi:hypothetical protein
LYINTFKTGNYLTLNLVGTKSNRDARGAVVTLTTGQGQIHRTNDGVEFYGQSKVPIHFGLGDDSIVDILVKWPSGIEEKFFVVEANQSFTITEGVGMEKTTVSAVVKTDGPGASSFSLLRNHPNPVFNGTKLHFQSVFTARIKIEIYDLNDRLVATPVEGYFSAGDHTMSWDGTDKNGNPLPVGIYIQKLSSGDFVAKSKLIKLNDFHQ